MLLPAMSKAKESAKRIQCLSQGKQIGAACHMYAADDSKQFFPDPDNAEWPHVNPLDFKNGLLWRYLTSEKVWICPNGPKGRIGGTGPTIPHPPNWNYVFSGQVGYSQFKDVGINPNYVKSSPSTVLWMMEQAADDRYAFDNTVMLFGWAAAGGGYYIKGDDSLGAYHGDGGILGYFDGHSAFMKRSVFLKHLSTPEGTKEIAGGYMGFYW